MAFLLDMYLALSKSIDLIDHKIGSHNKRVGYIAGSIARTMELPNDVLAKAIIAGLVHDIGVLKESEYDELVDFNYIGGLDYHSEIGYRLLNSCTRTKDIAPIVRYHHVFHNEKHHFDDGRNIPLAAEIIHVADRAEVLINHNACSLSQRNNIANKIQKYSGLRFNPEVVKSFLRLAEQESFWFDLQFNNIEKKIKSSIYYNPLLNLSDVHEFSQLFTKIIDFRSRYTATHSSTVAAVARELGSLLHLSAKECLMLDIAGNIHDIGKLAIPIELLEKGDALTQEEWRIMKQHPYFTYYILDDIGDSIFDIIKEWAAYHHEKINSNGYPFKVRGEDLSIGSRIVAVADMFTALAESRPYRQALDDTHIAALLNNAGGNELDPHIVNVLLNNYSFFKDVRETVQSAARPGFNELFDSYPNK